MKILYHQLEAQLNNKLYPVYILSGDELLLKQEALQWVRKAVKKAGFNERIRFAPDTGAMADQLYPTLYSPSLLAEKQLIELDFRGLHPDKITSKIFKEYAMNPASQQILLLNIDKVDAKTAKSEWYLALEKIGLAVTIWPIPKEQMPPWILNRAKKYKLTFTMDAAHLLAYYVEGNLMAAAQALEKIYLLAPPTAVDAELIKQVMCDESQFNIFDFVDHLLIGNTARSLHILTYLQAEGTEPTMILWAITRELRLLADLSRQIESGAQLEALLQKHKIFANRAKSMRTFLNRFSYKTCWHLLCQTAEIDKVIKGAISSDVWQQFHLFCLNFAKQE